MIHTVLEILGALLVIAGVALIYVPAALIAAGAAVLILSYLSEGVNTNAS